MLRHITAKRVAFTAWLLVTNTVVITRLSADVFDAWDRTGLPPGQPDPLARFLVGAGIPALDTVDGWPLIGDSWEETTPEGVKTLVVATADTPSFTYSHATASEPVSGVSTMTGFAVVADGRARFATYDLLALPVVSANLTPITVTQISLQIPNHKSVTFDTHSSASSDTADPLSWSHTLSAAGSPYIGVMGCVAGGGPTQSCTYNSAAMTSRAGQVVASTFRADYFDMTTMPPATGSNTVSLDYDTARASVGVALSCTGVDQTTPRTNITSATSTSTAPAFSGLGSASGEVVLSTVMAAGGSSLTNDTDNAWTTDEGADGTTGIKNPGSDVHQWGRHIDGAASIGRTDALSASVAWWIVGAAIKAATAATDTGEWMTRSHGHKRMTTPNIGY